ncbi:hypothetical protein CQ393_09560 [Stenotrophomonas sp. MYb238]|uniref:hypothetical protein n=1 Tax=Stenotrophomonas sp. MYb238 TaxID=2040281 RepID=UPI0012929039|nr:hypothetical protein [Stenotrophomonas sp. MYb238]MQP76137.1 hypothetical protein [Stenotrophomonas sp. MYb238]
MGRTLQRVVVGAIGLVLLLAIVLLVSWLWPLSAAQKRALAALETPRDLPGSNVYVTLATLGMEGALAQRQAAVEEHTRQFQQWYADRYVPAFIRGQAEGEAGTPPPLPGEDAPPPDVDAVLCGFNEAAACVDAVRRQPQAVAAALAPHATLLARMDELAAHGHYRSPLAQTGATPWPSLRRLGVPLSAHALAHVRGDSARALAGLCRDAGIGRMLMAQGDNLLTTMTGSRMLATNATVFAAVLAELPLDAPLPAACATALAPLSADEAGICNGMRGEFAMQRELAMLMDTRIEQAQRGGALFYSSSKTLAYTAQTLGDACLPETRQAIAEDRRLSAPPARVLAWWHPQCLTNSIGCILGNIAAPAYRGYASRQQDTAAQLRLLSAVLWLREYAGQDAATPLAGRLDGLPAGLRSAHRPITVSADGIALETPAYGGEGQMLRMPLPQAVSGH